MRRFSHRYYLVTGVMLCCAAVASGASRPAVVELFTSEGCSSCPPAEAYIGELTQRSDVLALTFHVDYWDDLGWRDRFGLPESVQRQRTYGRNLRLGSIYTPQVVLDGTDNFVGSNRAAIGHALTTSRGAAVPVMLSVHEHEILVTIGAGARAGAATGTGTGTSANSKAGARDVVLVAYQRTAISPIGRGENSGRTVKEFNIVRGFRTLGQWSGDAREYRAMIESLPRDATDVAVLVQTVGQASIVGAAALALRN